MQRICCVPLFLLSFLPVIFFAGCRPSGPIKIGFIGGTTGRAADLGISGQDAVQLAVEEVNRDGGIGGRPLQLIIKDDGQKSEKARRAVVELIDQQVEAVIGPMTSDIAMAIVPELNKARIVCISPTASTEELSGMDDYFFRLTAPVGKNASKSGAYHARAGKIHHLAVLYDLNNLAYTENWLENFKRHFEQEGNHIVVSMGFDTAAGVTFNEAVGHVLAAAPDGILIIANSMDSAMICQQIRKKDKSVHITLSDWGATERLLELGGETVEGVTVIQVFDRENANQLFQRFRQKYLERFQQEPGFGGVLAYDAAQVVIQALKMRQPGQTIKDAVVALPEIEGLQTSISFDKWGEREKTSSRMSIITGGKFLVLE